MRYLGLLLFLIVLSCTPKKTKVITEKPNIQHEPEQVEEIGPCATLNQLPTSKKDQVETAYVLYKDLIKQEKYDEALPLWEKAYYNAPAANGRIKYQFDDGVKMYKHFYAQASTDAQKSAFKDSVLSIYNKRIECFGDPAYIAGRKGFDMYYYMFDHSDQNEIYSLFKQAIDGKGEKMDYFIANPFAKILFDKAVNEEITKEEAGNYAQKLLNGIKYGVANCKEDCEAWKIVNDYAPPRLENLEGIKGLYPCSYFKEKYYKEFQQNPTDCEVINLAYRRMLYGDCDENDVAVQEIKNAKTTNCYVAPPKESTLRQAYNAYEAGNYAEAIQLFESFAASKDDIDKKSKYILLIAKIYYADVKNFTKARKYALQAAEIKSNWGDPYILIGKLYASSGPICGPGTGWDSQIVTWPAIDAFNKAKNIDPSVATEANKWIKQYTQYMPSREDIFIRGLKKGENFKVGCWINRSTTIRSAK